jgi:ABC-2 type transport system ATP-binding protein
MKPARMQLVNAGKRFSKEWVFRNINLTLEQGKHYAVTGSNGSGKSTLAQTVAGFITLTEGKLIQEGCTEEEFPLQVSFASPYLDLPESYTLIELLRMHFSLRKLIPGIKPEEVPAILELSHASVKEIRNYSSGMKQRVKLGLAMLSQSGILILDEPCSNFDAASREWYKRMIDNYAGERIVMVLSNAMEEEYSFCQTIYSMENFKKDPLIKA